MIYAMASKENQKWDGGYIRIDASGRKTYWIRKQLNGKRYEVSTRASTTKAAMKQLARFEENPSAYLPSGVVGDLTLDAELIAGFLAHSLGMKHNTPKWVNDQRKILAWWAGRLRGKDLRQIQAGEMITHLDNTPARSHKIAVIKALYSWLIKERHALKPAEDPTFRTIVVPRARPEQWKKTKAIPQADYLKAREFLTCDYAFAGQAGGPYAFREPSRYVSKQGWVKGTPSEFSPWRDGADVLAGTGWHVTELSRFARRGRIARHVSGKWMLECPQTKAGGELRTIVNDDVREAAERLLKHGNFSSQRFAIALAEASDKAGVAKILPGSFRHSVATWAIDRGSDPAAVSAFLNHKSTETTRRFYATHATPAKVPTLA